MSFSNDIDFHRFTLGFLFDWKYGGDIINLTEFLYDITANSKDYTAADGGAGPTGMELIERRLGGTVIEEIDEP